MNEYEAERSRIFNMPHYMPDDVIFRLLDELDEKWLWGDWMWVE